MKSPLFRSVSRLSQNRRPYRRPDFRSLRTLAQDRGAAVGPMIAVLGVALLASAGLALDVGLHQLGNRELRAATEAAALSASMDPANATSRARDYLTRNGYDPSVLKSVTIGRYCPDIHTTWDQRFDPSGTRCPGPVNNAVRLQTSAPSRRFLTGVLGTVVVPDLAATATATAARIDEAGIAVTSGLLTVTNSLVNSVNDLLGALIGIKLRLSTADIEALMGGNVDAGKFFDALAQRTGQTGTYSELVQGTYGLGDIANAAADAAYKPATAAALRVFAGQVGNGYQVPLSGLFGLGVWKNMPVGEADAQPALRAGINAYQLLTYAVQAGPGVVDLSDAVSLVAPGSTTRIAAVATGTADRPRFSFGPAGETSVATSQLRIQLLVGIPTLDLGLVKAGANLPILLDVASAQANINAISCVNTAEQATNTRVNVNVSSDLVNAYIGNAPANFMTKQMPLIRREDITPSTILDVAGILTVKAKAAVGPVTGTGIAQQTISFGPGTSGDGTIGSPTAPGRSATVGNTAATAATVNSLLGPQGLLGTDGLDIRVLGLCLPLVCASQQSTVRNVLLPAINNALVGLLGSTADPILDNVLAALGVQLGHATVWTTGARCGVPVLI